MARNRNRREVKSQEEETVPVHGKPEFDVRPGEITVAEIRIYATERDGAMVVGGEIMKREEFSGHELAATLREMADRVDAKVEAKVVAGHE